MDPSLSGSYFECAFSKKRPNLANGSARLPYGGDGLYQFDPPCTSSGCEAATLGDAAARRLSDPEKIITELHANWNHAAAYILRRVLEGSGKETLWLAHYADGVLDQ